MFEQQLMEERVKFILRVNNYSCPSTIYDANYTGNTDCSPSSGPFWHSGRASEDARAMVFTWILSDPGI